jgi:hypothetical protein
MEAEQSYEARAEARKGFGRKAIEEIIVRF